MNVTEAIETRLEIRDFAHETVEEATKRAILDAARLAPSGKNLYQWSFILVDDRAALERFADVSTSGTWVRDADFAVVVLTDPSYHYHDIDTTRAVTHRQRQAWNQGAGSCIYTGDDEARMRELLAFPEDLHPMLVAGFGYPTRPVPGFIGSKDHTPVTDLVHHGCYGTELEL